MEERLDRAKINRQIHEEAAEWWVHFNTQMTDAAARREFDQWLRASPEHIRAYIELSPLWHDSASLAEVNTLSREELIALGTRQATTVAPFPAKSEIGAITKLDTSLAFAGDRRLRRLFRRRRMLTAAAAVLVALAASGLLYRSHSSGSRHFQTETAEVRAVTLEDGTKLTIGARSAVTVRYSPTARALELQGGDLYVEVAKEPMRPFVVEAKGRSIRALGTQFEVRADDQTMRVAVIEGMVSVSKTPLAFPRVNDGAGSGSTGVLLRAGQQLTTRRNDRLEAPQPIRSKEPAAWRSGRLVFDEATLGDVVREFNRYNARPLRLADASLENIPIAAAFSSADPASLIRFLQDQPGISVTQRHGEILIESY